MIQKKYAPQIIFLLMTSTLCMSYFNVNVLMFQIFIYVLVFISYLYSAKGKVHPQIAQYNKLFTVFVVLYIFRAFIELEILNHNQELFANNSTIYFFMVTGMLLPAFFICKMRVEESYEKVFVILAIIVTAALLSSLYNIFTGNIFYSADHRIQGNENLGVIQYGHLGLTGAISGYLSFANKNFKKPINYFGFGVMIVGFITMLMAGTRGAMVSAFVIIVAYLLAHAKIRSFIIVSIVFIALLQFLDIILSVFDSLGANSVIRMLESLSESGDQSSGRSDLWANSISEILESPIIGVSCFFNSKGNELTYVHNSFIEITYAMGVFGLWIFIKLNAIAMKACLISFRSANLNDMAFSFFYLQYFTYTLFSESIIRVPLFWFFLLMMLNIRNKQLINNI